MGGGIGSWGLCCEKMYCNHIFYANIRVLLIYTNSMIYICYIKYTREAGICVLDVGNDVAASSEVAAGRTRAGRLGKVTRMDLVSQGHGKDGPGHPKGWGQPGIAGDGNSQESL